MTDLSKVPKEKLRASLQVRTFVVGNEAAHPNVTDYLGEVTAYSCKQMPTDPPASQGNALTQLRLKALDLGADGIIDVTFDVRGTDAFGTNCWESVQASGTAVRFER